MMLAKKRRTTRTGPLAALLAAALGACAAPDPAPLELPELTAAARERAPAPSSDNGDAMWHETARAWNVHVRRAGAAVTIAREEARSAGWPGPIGLGYRAPDFENVDDQGEGELSLDLLGWLGAGPAAEEVTVARARVDRSEAELVDATRRACFAVDRARVRLVVARRRERLIAAHLSEARKDLHRLELLADLGRLGAGPLGRARAVLASLGEERTTLETEIARREADLASAAGLTPDAAAIRDLVALPELPVALPATPTDLELLERLPGLVTARVTYALAEADVRRVAVETWPRVRIGPRVTLSPDRLLPGGILAIDLPVPGAFAGAIDAALARREDARAAVEDALVGALSELATRRTEARLAREILAREAPARDFGSAAAWRAARAIVAIEEGLGPVETWLDAFALRAGGIRAPIDAVERAWLADLDLREAAAAAAGLDPAPATTDAEAGGRP